MTERVPSVNVDLLIAIADDLYDRAKAGGGWVYLAVMAAKDELIALRVEVEAHRARAAAVERLVEAAERLIESDATYMLENKDLIEALAAVKGEA